MNIISDGYFDIDKGREKILELGQRFAMEWTDTLEILKDIYTAKYKARDQEVIDRWEQEVKDAEELWLTKVKKNKASLVVWRVLIFIGIVIALVVGLLFFAAPLLVMFFLAPVAGGFLLVVFIVFSSINSKNKRLVNNGPDRPYEPDLFPSKFPMSSILDLERDWWRKMSAFRVPSSGPGSRNNYGATGEDNLVRELSYPLVGFHNRLDNNYVCIKNLLVGKKLDADVVLLGPKGIWILESKYISGTIRLRNKAWTREKTYYAPGGNQVFEENDLPDFEEQWLREKEAIEKTIKDNFPKLAQVEVPLIRGGLVFTHEKSKLDLDTSLKIPHGTTKDWVSFLEQEKGEELLSQKQIIELANVLLNKSKELGTNNSRSAVDVALEVYKESVESMLIECKEHEIPVETEMELSEA